MPCMSYEDRPVNYKPELDRVTAMLCKVCSYSNNIIPPEIKAWYEQHYQADKEYILKMLIKLEESGLMTIKDYTTLRTMLGGIGSLDAAYKAKMDTIGRDEHNKIDGILSKY